MVPSRHETSSSTHLHPSAFACPIHTCTSLEQRRHTLLDWQLKLPQPIAPACMAPPQPCFTTHADQSLHMEGTVSSAAHCTLTMSVLGLVQPTQFLTPGLTHRRCVCYCPLHPHTTHRNLTGGKQAQDAAVQSALTPGLTQRRRVWCCPLNSLRSSTVASRNSSGIAVPSLWKSPPRCHRKVRCSTSLASSAAQQDTKLFVQKTADLWLKTLAPQWLPALDRRTSAG